MTVSSSIFHNHLLPVLEISKLTLIHSAPTIAALVSTALLAQLIIPSLSLSLLTMASTLVVTQVIIRLHHVLAFPLRSKMYDVDHTYPYLKTAAIVASLSLAYFATPLGLMSAALTGIYLGIQATLEENSLKQPKLYKKKITLSFLNKLD